jgi:beta-ribofuranosylaminobenzene 5'-phosphate synthase
MGGSSTEVTVKTPSRLHFGIIDMRGDLGRIHGSVGVAVDHPHLLLKALPSEELKVEGTRKERVKHYAKKVLESAGVD